MGKCNDTSDNLRINSIKKPYNIHSQTCNIQEIIESFFNATPASAASLSIYVVIVSFEDLMEMVGRTESADSSNAMVYV